MMAATTGVGMSFALAVTRAGIGRHNEGGQGEEEDTVMGADGYRQQSTKSSNGNGRCNGDSNKDSISNGNCNGNGNSSGNCNGAMKTATTINNKWQQKKPRRQSWQQRWRRKWRQWRRKLWWQRQQSLLCLSKGQG
jgi:hypothetical protein